jgi:heme-degrading monooxygenase HmoA
MGPDPFIAIWEYAVRPDQLGGFVEAYGPSGAWAQLFRRAPGYRGTELYRDREDPLRFVTIDFWLNEAAWSAFRRDFAAEYAALDRRCEVFSSAERPLGRFRLAQAGSDF